MAARAGLTRSDVVTAAVSMIDESRRLESATLGAVARRLGIRPQSLYAHVDGADGLRRALALAGLDALAAEVVHASIGVGGIDAVRAIVRAHLGFARRRPALYEAALHPPGDDPRHRTAIADVSSPLEIVLRGMGRDDEAIAHWTRLFLSSVYGYTSLHAAGNFSLPFDTDSTEAQLVEMLVHELEAGVTRTGSGRGARAPRQPASRS